jgi:hypothetical protein
MQVSGKAQARLETEWLVSGLPTDPHETVGPTDLGPTGIEGQMRGTIERQYEGRLRHSRWLNGLPGFMPE